jgi:hypothetical protein
LSLVLFFVVTRRNRQPAAGNAFDPMDEAVAMLISASWFEKRALA